MTTKDDPRGDGPVIDPGILEDGQPNIIDYSNDEPLLFGLGDNSSHEYPGKIVINNESRYVDRAVKHDTTGHGTAKTGEGAVGENRTQPTLPTGAPQILPDHNMSGFNFNQKIDWNEAVKLDPMAGDLKQDIPASQAFTDEGNNPHITPEIELQLGEVEKLGKPFPDKSDTGDDLSRTGPGGENPQDNYDMENYHTVGDNIKLNIATPLYDDRRLHDVSGVVPELQTEEDKIRLIPNELKEDIMITDVYQKEEETRDLYGLLIAAGLIIMTMGEFQTAMKSGDYQQLKSLKRKAKKVTEDITKVGGVTIPQLKPYDFVRYQYNMQENCPICKPLDKLEFWVDDPKRPIVPSENLGRGVYNTHPNCKCSNIPFIKLLADDEAPKSVNKGKSQVTKDSLAERVRITKEYLRPLEEAVNYRKKAPAEFNWIGKETIASMQKHADSKNEKGRFILAVVSGESYTDHRIEGKDKHRRHWTEDELRQNIRTGKGKLMDINHLLPKKDPYSGGIFDANWNETTKRGEMILFEQDEEILKAIRNDIITAVSINSGPPRSMDLNCDSGECLLEPKGTHLGNHNNIALSYVVTAPEGFTYNGQWLYPLPPGMKITKLYLVE